MPEGRATLAWPGVNAVIAFALPSVQAAAAKAEPKLLIGGGREEAVARSYERAAAAPGKRQRDSRPALSRTGAGE
jgi:hypothetical protein